MTQQEKESCAKFWRINRTVLERYFGKKLYEELLKKEDFEEMERILAEALSFKE